MDWLEVDWLEVDCERELREYPFTPRGVAVKGFNGGKEPGTFSYI